MANKQTIEGNWKQIKGSIQQRWGHLTDSELDQAEGNMTELAGLIQRRTGETQESIENFLSDLNDETSSTFNQATAAVKEYANMASENATEMAQQAADQVKAGYEQTEQLVRRHPVESLAVCFGVGVITGVVTSLLIRR